MPQNQSQSQAAATQGAAPRPYMETASATTNPDNANSGNTAYAITAIVLVVLLLLGNALGGLVSGLVRGAASDGIDLSQSQREDVDDLLQNFDYDYTSDDRDDDHDTYYDLLDESFGNRSEQSQQVTDTFAS